MLTRIEIDGFKSFEEFGLDLGPFTVLMGANASGKSNLFDALRFLSSTATMDLRGAARAVRGEALGMFRRDAAGIMADRFTIAVELLLPRQVTDPFGQTYALSQTRIRYELTVGIREAESGLARMVVLNEQAAPIRKREGDWVRSSAGGLPRESLAYGRSGYKPFLTTDHAGERAQFLLHQDGRAGRSRPAAAAESTILREITTAEDFRHLFALRLELASWRFLQLDPAALRLPSSDLAADALEPDGANLATVLHRIRSESAEPAHPQGALADIAVDLTALIPGFESFEVEHDQQGRQHRVRIAMDHEPVLPSQVASDGTLRLLALLALLHDPRQSGLVCFEEPENGLHPSRVQSLIARLREMTSTADAGEASTGHRLQFLLNSHSPVVLAAISLDDGEGAFVDPVSIARPGAEQSGRRTRVRPIRQLLPVGGQEYVSPVEVERFLSHARPPNREEAEE